MEKSFEYLFSSLVYTFRSRFPGSYSSVFSGFTFLVQLHCLTLDKQSLRVLVFHTHGDIHYLPLLSVHHPTAWKLVLPVIWI